MRDRYTTFLKIASLGLLVASVVGCGGGEKAIVPISYVLEPTKGLPPGLTAATSSHWSATKSPVNGSLHSLEDDGLAVRMVSSRRMGFALPAGCALNALTSPGRLPPRSRFSTVSRQRTLLAAYVVYGSWSW